MTPQQFIQEVITLYRKAREVSLPVGEKVPTKIRRGRNRVISGQLEDLFAFLLYQHFPEIDKIVIDQPLSSNDAAQKMNTIYPDILLIQKGKIRAIIDMKTDLGRKREELENILVKASATITQIQGKALKYKDGITKDTYPLAVSKKVKYFVVVLSRQNINPADLATHLSNIKANKQIKHTKVYFLTDDVHPNRAIYKNTLERIRILDEFSLLVRDIGKALK